VEGSVPLTGRIVTVDVYEPNNSTRIGELPFWKNLRWLDEYNDEGSASIEVPMGSVDFKFWEPDNVYRVLLDGNAVFAFRVGDYTTENVDEDGNRLVSIDGWTLWSLLDDIAVYPDLGIGRNVPDNRPFDFQSREDTRIRPKLGNWSDTEPIKRQGDDTGYKDGYPKRWPDPDAWWNWVEPLATDDSVESGVSYVRVDEFETTSDGLDYSLLLTCDDFVKAWLDGEELVDNQEFFAWQDYQRSDLILDAREHHLGMEVETVDRGGSNSSGSYIVLLVRTKELDDWEDKMSDWDDKNEPKPKVADSEILMKSHNYDPTDTTYPYGRWKVLPRPTNDPGWTPGGVLGELVHEARGRADNEGTTHAAHTLSMTFLHDESTNGVAYDDWVAISVDSSSDTLKDVAFRIIESGFDISIGPTGDLNLYNDRSVDRTGEVRFDESNLLDAKVENEGSGANVILGRYDEGYVEERTTPYRGIRREKPLSLGRTENEDQAVREMQQALENVAGGVENITLVVAEVDEASYLPYRDFDPSDKVLIDMPNYRKQTEKIRSVSGSVDNDGKLTWEVEVSKE